MSISYSFLQMKIILIFHFRSYEKPLLLLYKVPKTIRGGPASMCNQKDTQDITTINMDGI